MLVFDVVEAKLVLLACQEGHGELVCLEDTFCFFAPFSFEQLASHDFVALRRAGEFHRSRYKVETAPRHTQELRTTSSVDPSLPLNFPPDFPTTCDR